MNPLSSVRALALAGLFLCGWAVPHAHAATLTVQSTANTYGASCGATCTLRQALNAANATSAADTIVFAPRVFGSSKQTIALSAPLPPISAPVTIIGPSTPGTWVTLDAKGKCSIFTIKAGIRLTLSYLTLTGGRAYGGSGFYAEPAAGAAIHNSGTITMSNCTLSGNNSHGFKSAYGVFYNEGTATVSNCTFSNNSASANGDPDGFGYFALGGAIANSGTALTLNNCTFSNCSVRGGRDFGLGGALYSDKGAVKVSNCTFTGNSSDLAGGAIYNRQGPLELSSCTLTGNTSRRGDAIYNCGSTLKLSNSIVVGNGGQDIYRGSDPLLGANSQVTLISDGHNLVGSASGASFSSSDKTRATSEQVKLGELADNGGPTQTLALLPGSIAIDAGQTTLATDQRGVKRPQGSAPDIGAFELPALSVNSPSVKEGNSGTTALTFTLTLSQASTSEVSVLVNTRQGTAKAGSDYVSVPRATITFAPGITKQTFTVQVNGDTRVENDETFQLDLRSPVGATISTASGTGTIVNDDKSSTASVNEVSLPEEHSGTRRETHFQI